MVEMKNRILLLVLVSMILTLTAMAQNGPSSTSATAGQGTPAAQSEREPLEAPKAANFWDGDDPNLVNLFTHPFANKKYVQRYTVPIRDRVNELDEITSESANQIKDVDSRSQKGLQLASEKVNLADQHASDASSKSQMAQTAATQASTRVSTAEQMVGNLDQYKGSGQTEIRFRPGQSVLSKTAKDALDQMAEPLKNQRSYIIEVHGFSSGHGQSAIANSQKMSDSVVRYLVLTHKIPVYRIYTTNLGNTSMAGGKSVSGGRVEVNVLKNELTAAAQ
jgi:outer membrane protein OmpA-like peptidoglycan-associated protein